MWVEVLVKRIEREIIVNVCGTHIECRTVGDACLLHLQVKITISCGRERVSR